MSNVHSCILSNIMFILSGYFTNDTNTVHIRYFKQFTSYHWYHLHQMFGTVYQLPLVLSTSDVWNSLPATTGTVHIRCLEQFTRYHWYYPDVWNMCKLPLILFIQMLGTVYQLPLVLSTSDVWNSLQATADTSHFRCLEQFTNYCWYQSLQMFGTVY